jgi:hypothetical protein
LLPFDKARLTERNALDAEDERARAHGDAAAAFTEALDLSETVRELARATGSLDHAGSLKEKAHFFVRPLLALARK